MESMEMMLVCEHFFLHKEKGIVVMQKTTAKITVHYLPDMKAKKTHWGNLQWSFNMMVTNDFFASNKQRQKKGHLFC